MEEKGWGATLASWTSLSAPLSGSFRICLSKALADMDMADYSEALDPAYTTLEFENMQVLPLGTGELRYMQLWVLNFETFTDLKLCSGEDRGSSGLR